MKLPHVRFAMRRLTIAMAIVSLASLPTQAQGPGEANKSIVSDGMGIIIASSVSGKTLYGYSLGTGNWESLTVSNPDNVRLSPVIGSGVAYVTIGKTIHAFSYSTGRWATLDLPEAVEPKLGGSRIRIDLGTKIYVFSGGTGKWSTVDLALDKM